MSLKKIKKSSGLQLAALLLVAVFAIVVGACPEELIPEGYGGTSSVNTNINLESLKLKITEANNTKIAVLVDTDGSNTASDEHWVIQAVMTDLEIAIILAEFVKDNATTQTMVNKAVTDLNTAITAFNAAKQEGTKTTLILTGLNNKIAEANNAKSGVETDTSAGNVALGTPWVTLTVMDTFENAISAAESAKRAATQEEVDEAVNTLSAAITAFESAKGTGTKLSGFTPEQLAELIARAKAARTGVEVNTAASNVDQGKSWVTQAVMNALNNAINNADNADITGNIDSVYIALSDALNSFSNALDIGTKVNYDQLNTVIASANNAKTSAVVDTSAANVDEGKYWVTQAVMDTFETAISAAESAKTATTQAAVDTAVTTLSAAITTFNSARQLGTKAAPINTDALAAKIAEARTAKEDIEVNTASANVDEGVKWVTQAVMTTFNNAITVAESALTATTQAAVDAMVTTLSTAITTFNTAKQTGTKVAGPLSVDYGATLSWGNTPYNPDTLGLTPGNTTTEINVNWLTAGNTTIGTRSAYVRFIEGTKNAGYDLIEKTGSVATATSSTAIYHFATVTGLKPGKSYQYSVSVDNINWSQMYDYKAPPATGTWKFAVITDAQIHATTWDANGRYTPTAGARTANGWAETVAKIAAVEGVTFIVSCGDQIDSTSGTTVPAAEYTSFFAPPALRSLPLAPVVGNHDTAAQIRYHFALPNDPNARNSDTSLLGNYYYLYNNILFVGLNDSYGNYTTMTRAQADPYITRFNTTITNATLAHAGKYDWLIVYHHKSTASVADHLADKDIQAYVEAGFEKIMSNHNVDFVLAGHDHVYARSYPLSGRDDGKVSVPNKTFPAASGSTWNNPGDPIYLTFTTASGLKYYQVSSDPYFPYNNTLYVKNNSTYPYLGESTAAEGSTYFGSTEYMNNKRLPVSNAAFVQPYIPSYTIVEVSNSPTGTKSITFSTYPIATKSGQNSPSLPYSFDETKPYDSITVTK